MKIVCANCKKEIPAGESYYVVGDNYLRMNYFDTEKDNAFCSHDCVCEFLSVLEVPNDVDESIEDNGNNDQKDILRIMAHVEFPEDAEVNGNEDDSENPKMPFIVNKEHSAWCWDIVVDIDTGRILAWPSGTTAKTYYKTSDQCELRYNGKRYIGYVPEFLQIFANGYDDYIHVNVLEDGSIENWNVKGCRKWLLKNSKEFN